MLSSFMLSIVRLSVVRLNVVMLSVVSPLQTSLMLVSMAGGYPAEAPSGTWDSAH
jgi:hypothetical protein